MCQFVRQHLFVKCCFCGDGLGENWCLGHQQAARCGRVGNALRSDETVSRASTPLSPAWRAWPEDRSTVSQNLRYAR